MVPCPPQSCPTRAERAAAPGGAHALAATQGSSAAAAELWARLGALPPVAASFYQLYKYDEMRTMLGVMGKALSKAELSQRLEHAAISPGFVPTDSSGQVVDGQKPSSRARGRASRRGKDADGQGVGSQSDPHAPTRRCTQTLARGWYTPKCISSPTTAATKAIKTGDVVWCKLGDAPWWPALVAEPVTDSQLADKKQAFKRGATTFVIFYPYTTECSYEWFRPRDLKLFDPCQLSALAGRAKHYRQPGWDCGHMAQALADASAEAISNMSLEGLREAVKRSDPAAAHCATKGDGNGMREDGELSAAELRATLVHRACQCRIRVFGDARLGSLEVSHAAPGDAPDTDGEDTDDEDDDTQECSLNGNGFRPQVRSPGQPVTTRLSKHAREYMVNTLHRWCIDNPGATMPSKDEKQSLSQRCGDSTGEDVSIRHLEYWFWMRNRKQKHSDYEGSSMLPLSQQNEPRTANTSLQNIDAHKAGQVIAQQDEATAKTERQRFDLQAAQIAARYLRHQQETPLYRLLHGRGGALSPPSLRARPVDCSLPMVVVHPQATGRADPVVQYHSRQDCADSSTGSTHAAISRVEHVVYKDADLLGPYGSSQLATTSCESVFCPRFDTNAQYETILADHYLKGKAERAAKRSNPLSAALAGDSSDDEPAAPATWRSQEVFLEPPSRSELARYPKRSRGGSCGSKQKRQRLHDMVCSTELSNHTSMPEARSSLSGVENGKLQSPDDKSKLPGRVWHTQKPGRPPANKRWDGWQNCWVDDTSPIVDGEHPHDQLLHNAVLEPGSAVMSGPRTAPGATVVPAAAAAGQSAGAEDPVGESESGSDRAREALAERSIQCLAQHTNSGAADSWLKHDTMDPNWKQVMNTASQRMQDAILVSSEGTAVMSA